MSVPVPPFTEEELLAADRARNGAKKRGGLTRAEWASLEQERLRQEVREGHELESPAHPWARRYPFTP